MSRNFELLHEAGKVQEMLRQRGEQPMAPSPEEFVPGAPALRMEEAAGEEVTKLVQRLFLMSGSAGPRQVVFTATERGAGCSFICAHAADILSSRVPGSVCLVDCNLQQPTLHQEFRVRNHYGLSDALSNSDPIRQFVQQLSRPNLWLLSCGSNRDSQQLLASERMRKRMFELRAEFDYVLLDVAPLDSGNEGAVLGSWCDGVTLVLKANSSSRKAAQKAVQDVLSASAPVLGAVLNQRTFPIPDSIYSRL
jgi:polysaccharide biosynthesis transport protein